MLLTAFTFTFSPSQVFSSFYRINLFYYFILHSKYGVYLLQKRLQHLSLYTNLLFSNTHSLTICFPHIGHFFVVLLFLLSIFTSYPTNSLMCKSHTPCFNLMKIQFHNKTFATVLSKISEPFLIISSKLTPSIICISRIFCFLDNFISLIFRISGFVL